MDLRGKTILVTGAAGLIGSQMCKRLPQSTDVIAVDDLSKGGREWVPERASFVQADLTNEGELTNVLTEDIDLVIHFAARSDANDSNPRRQFTANLEMIYNILEQMNEVGVSALATASSSAVYGEAPRPTPEDHAPLKPISEYGASKLGAEGVVSTYAHSYDLTAWQFRFANVVGPHQRDNVIPDFVEKLLDDPNRLRILGNGLQEKSYIHVEDCIDAMCHIIKHSPDRPNNIYNIGTRTTTSVTRIADLVAKEMGLDPEYEYTGGSRGWIGDVPKMKLSTQKLMALNWTPAMSSDEAIRKAARQLRAELKDE